VTFRVKIITPIQVDEADLQRRRHRYAARAGPHTEISVVGLRDGPSALETGGDVEASHEAVFEEAVRTRSDECDAILIDCIFDPAVDRLRERLPVPVFGPLRTALSLLSLVAPNFAIVARASGHEPLFRELVARYGFGDRLIAVRTLALPYVEARRPERFDAAMREQLRAAVEQDDAGAVVMGSTTMALTPELTAVAGKVPLFLTGMATLGVMESLWRDGALSRRLYVSSD
jgi:allantoin racemase